MTGYDPHALPQRKAWYGVDFAKPGDDHTVLAWVDHYGGIHTERVNIRKRNQETASMKDWNDKGPMTIRDRFVASAMQGLLADSTTIENGDIRDLSSYEISVKANETAEVTLTRLGYGDPVKEAAKTCTAGNEQMDAYASAASLWRAGPHFRPGGVNLGDSVRRQAQANELKEYDNAEVAYLTGVVSRPVNIALWLGDQKRCRWYVFRTEALLADLPAGAELRIPPNRDISYRCFGPHGISAKLKSRDKFQLSSKIYHVLVPAGLKVQLPDAKRLKF
jgi:hypothetical protein